MYAFMVFTAAVNDMNDGLMRNTSQLGRMRRVADSATRGRSGTNASETEDCRKRLLEIMMLSGECRALRARSPWLSRPRNRSWGRAHDTRANLLCLGRDKR